MRIQILDILKIDDLKYFPYDQINDEDDYEGMWNARKSHLLILKNKKKIHVSDHHNWSCWVRLKKLILLNTQQDSFFAS